MGAAEQMGFDNHDQRIRYYGLVLERGWTACRNTACQKGIHLYFTGLAIGMPGSA